MVIRISFKRMQRMLELLSINGRAVGCTHQGALATCIWQIYYKPDEGYSTTQKFIRMDDATPGVPSAKSGYKFVDIFQTDVIGFEATTDSIRKFRSGCLPDMLNLPKKDYTTGTEFDIDYSAATNIRYVIVETQLSDTEVANFVNKFARGINLNPPWAGENPNDEERQRYIYLNDLMQHRQPYGPTSTRRNRL